MGDGWKVALRFLDVVESWVNATSEVSIAALHALGRAAEAAVRVERKAIEREALAGREWSPYTGEWASVSPEVDREGQIPETPHDRNGDCGKPLGKGVCRMPWGHEGPHMNMFRSEPRSERTSPVGWWCPLTSRDCERPSCVGSVCWLQLEKQSERIKAMGTTATCTCDGPGCDASARVKLVGDLPQGWVRRTLTDTIPPHAMGESDFSANRVALYCSSCSGLLDPPLCSEVVERLKQYEEFSAAVSKPSAD